MELRQLSRALLDPERTAEILCNYQNDLPDITAQWLLNTLSASEQHATVRAFARLLPFAPSLVDHLTILLDRLGAANHAEEALDSLIDIELDLPSLTQNLLAVLRLLAVDREYFVGYLTPIKLVDLLRSPHRAVKYIAVRVLALYAHFSDGVMREYLQKYVGEEPVRGPYEEKEIDYEFIDFWEQQRLGNLNHELHTSTIAPSCTTPDALLTRPRGQDQDPYVAELGDVRLACRSRRNRYPTQLINTRSTHANLSNIGTALSMEKPVLLTGPPASGKTALINETARQLDRYEGMLVLHLNQQTDARALVGSYVSDAKPGTFLWQPGVLTTALTEGRWILIEDIDQAPNEVLSLLLPVIEDRRLIISSRQETVSAHKDFRLFATIRSVRDVRNAEIPSPSSVHRRLAVVTYSRSASSRRGAPPSRCRTIRKTPAALTHLRDPG